MPQSSRTAKWRTRLAPRHVFFRRLATNAGFAVLIILGSLAAGIAGYVGFAHMALVDAFLNAAMILSGMGPVGDLPNDAAKIFAGLYALYSGIVIIATTGVILAPILHRMMHRFHLADEGEGGGTNTN